MAGIALFHWGLVVADLAEGAAALGDSLELTFSEAIESAREYVDPVTGVGTVARLRATYSRQGPPYVELIEILEPAGPFSLDDIGRIHHVGAWCDDVAALDARFTADGRVYHQVMDRTGEAVFALLTEPWAGLGARVEYASTAARPTIEAWTTSGRYPT